MHQIVLSFENQMFLAQANILEQKKEVFFSKCINYKSIKCEQRAFWTTYIHKIMFFPQKLYNWLTCALENIIVH